MYVELFVFFIYGSINYSNIFIVSSSHHLCSGFEEFSISIIHDDFISSSIHNENSIAKENNLSGYFIMASEVLEDSDMILYSSKKEENVSA